MKAVFETSGASRYNDAPASHYQFPTRYLRIATETVGDWIVYRETRKHKGSMCYFGVAHVDAVEADTKTPGRHYARMSQLVEFDSPVPFVSANVYAEEWARNLENRSEIGPRMRGSAMRIMTERDFAAIVNAGLSRTLDPVNAIRLELDQAHIDDDTAKIISTDPIERVVREMLVNKKIRDAAFRHNVLDAYDRTCAVTGLRILNGGGKAEAQAAHVRPVEHGGPDVVQNGMALSATAHWLFDRHLISLTDDYRLLVSDNKVPSELRGLFPSGDSPIRLPKDERSRPHLDFVRWHRDVYAGGHA